MSFSYFCTLLWQKKFKLSTLAPVLQQSREQYDSVCEESFKLNSAQDMRNATLREISFQSLHNVLWWSLGMIMQPLVIPL